MTALTTPRRRRLLGLAGAMFVFGFMFLTAPTASAEVPSGEGGPAYNICGQTDQTVIDKQYAASDVNLPVNRWQGVASGPLHTRLGAKPFDDISQKVQRNVSETGALEIGNTAWQASVQMTEYADRFCLADTIGAKVDAFVATLGNAVISSGLAVAALVGGLVASLWRATRRGGGSPLAGIGKAMLSTIILVVMVSGAAQTHGNQYGTFSPGWVATRINNAVSALSQAPASAISAGSTDLTGLTTSTGNQIGCGPYVNTLLRNYTNSYTGFGMSNAATVPKVMDAMWENSGLNAFIKVQFGSANPYGTDVYCHLLELNANGVTPQQQQAIFAQSAPGAAKALNLDSLAVSGDYTNKTIDRALIAYAACRYGSGGWAVDPQWASVKGPNGNIGAKDCADFWTKTKGDYDSASSPFEWPDSPGQISEATNDSAQIGVRDFLLNFHGDSNQSATTVAYTFAAMSILVAFVFMILAGAVLVAKVMLLVLTLMVIFALLIDSFLTASPAGGNRTIGLLKSYIGTTFFAFGSSFILSLIAILAGFVSSVGSGIGGGGSLISVLTTGAAPVIGAFLVHMGFKHILKAPSPFKLTAGSTWGAAAGGVALGAGLEAWHDRHQMRMRYGAQRQVARYFGRSGPMRIDPDGRIHGMPTTEPRARSGGASPLEAAEATSLGRGAPAPPTGASGKGSGGAAPTAPGRHSAPAPGAGHSRRDISRIARARLAAEAGYTGRLASARAAVARSWQRTTPAQKAVRAAKLAGLGLAAATAPVALPASLIGLGVAYELNRRRRDVLTGESRRAQYARQSEMVAAYNRAMAKEQDHAAPRTSAGGTAPAPAVADPQTVIDAANRRRQGRAPTPRQYGPGGAQVPPRRQVAGPGPGTRPPRVAGPRQRQDRTPEDETVGV